MYRLCKTEEKNTSESLNQSFNQKKFIINTLPFPTVLKYAKLLGDML